MVLIRILSLLVVLSSCKPSGREVRALVGLAPDDAAAAPALDLAAPWALHAIAPGAATGSYRGADGVDLLVDAEGLHIASAWEEGGIVTVSRLAPGATPTAPWDTVVMGSGMVGVEDAKFGDLDGDGVLDVASASDAGARVYISFGGGPTIDLAASHGHNRVMQVAIGDVDADGRPDILFGSRVGTAGNLAVIAWLGNPGAAARDGAAWTYHSISLAGWAMSVLPLDVNGDGHLDVVVSDRASYKDAGGVTRWDLYGARWEEQTATGWTTHAISPPAGACATCTPGDEMFLRVADWDGDGALDVLDGTSSSAHPNRLAIRRNLGGWASWSQEIVAATAVPNVGHYHTRPKSGRTPDKATKFGG